MAARSMASKGTDAAAAAKPMRWLLVLGMFSIQLTNVRRAERGIVLHAHVRTVRLHRGAVPLHGAAVVLFVVCGVVKDTCKHAQHYREWPTCLNDVHEVQCLFSPRVRFAGWLHDRGQTCSGKEGKRGEAARNTCIHSPHAQSARACNKCSQAGSSACMHATTVACRQPPDHRQRSPDFEITQGWPRRRTLSVRVMSLVFAAHCH
jgi:hypothetical protein